MLETEDTAWNERASGGAQMHKQTLSMREYRGPGNPVGSPVQAGHGRGREGFPEEVTASMECDGESR